MSREAAPVEKAWAERSSGGRRVETIDSARLFLVCLARIRGLMSVLCILSVFVPRQQHQDVPSLNIGFKVFYCYRPKWIFSMKKSHRRTAESFNDQELQGSVLSLDGSRVCSFFVSLPQSLFFFLLFFCCIFILKFRVRFPSTTEIFFSPPSLLLHLWTWV